MPLIALDCDRRRAKTLPSTDFLSAPFYRRIVYQRDGGADATSAASGTTSQSSSVR